MEKFQKNKGIRIGAILLVLLLLANSIPYPDTVVVQANEVEAIIGAEEGMVETGEAVEEATPKVEQPETEAPEDEVTKGEPVVGEIVIIDEIGNRDQAPPAKSGVVTGAMTEALAEITGKNKKVKSAPKVFANDTEDPGSENVVTYAISVSANDLESDNVHGTVSVTDNNNETIGDAANITAGENRTVEAVPEEGYKITSVVVTKGEDGTVWMPDESETDWWQTYISEGNGSFSYEFAVDDNYAFTFIFDVVCHEVTIKIEGNGTLSENNVIIENDGKVSVEHGGSITLQIDPDSDCQIEAITVGGLPVTSSDCSAQDNGSYQYTLENITESTEIKAEFGQIQFESGTAEEKGINLLDQNGNALVDTDNIYYTAETVTLMAGGSTWIRLADTEAYKDKITLANSTKISEVYLWNPDTGFGTECKVTLTEEISVVVDNVAPVFDMTEGAEIIKIGKSDRLVDVTGHFIDANLDYVKFSLEELNESDILKKETGIVVGTNKKFSFFGQSIAENTEILYLYAVDKIGNYTSQEIAIYRDGEAPVINGILFTESTENTIQKYSYGNFSNTTVSITVSANDVSEIDGTPCNATEIQSLKVYSQAEGDLDDIVKVGEGTTIDGVTSYEITVEAPEEGSTLTLDNIKFQAIDAVGNVSEVYTLNAFASNTGIESGRLIIDCQKPEIIIIPKQIEGGKENWFKEIPEIVYTANDIGSGFTRRYVYLSNKNGTEIELTAYTKDDYTQVENYASVIKNETDTVTIAEMTSGENVLKFVFEDIAGNRQEKTQTIYIDNVSPEIVRFTLGGDINSFQYGSFTKETVKITVEANDAIALEDGSYASSAGLKEITLYLDEEFYTASVADGKAVFEIPADEVLELEDDTLYLDATVKAIVTDMVGNKSEKCRMTTGNSNMLSSDLMIETTKPTINVEIAGTSYTNDNQEMFYSEKSNIRVKLTAEDKHSGLASVTVKVNGTAQTLKNATISAEQKTATITDEFVIENAEENSYVITFEIVDNAGNATSISRNIYRDTDAPTITKFKLGAETEEVGTVISTDYGNYFTKKTTVTVTAKDGGEIASGVQSIQYYLEDANQTKVKEATLHVNIDGEITFDVEAGFKGQIHAKAADNVENAPEEFVNPKGLILETPAQHEKEKHIILEKSNAAYSSNGQEIYADDVNVTIVVKDTFSGILSAEWSVVSPFDTGKNQQGIVKIDESGKTSGDAGWKIAKTDRNLVTQIQKTIKISNDSNDIVVTINMEDRAGNTSEEEIKFSIDKTAPVIEITFDNENPDSEFNTVYKDSRIATISVKERNFSPENITAVITNTDGFIPPISTWQTSENASNPDETESTATIAFEQDGDYTLMVSGYDAVRNEAEAVEADDFTIDKTLPVISVTYNNESPMNGNYYAAERIATVQVEEHNFTADRIQIQGTVTNGDAAFPAIGAWSSNGDIHQATIRCQADGLYQFDVEYMDMAGNSAEQYIGEEYYVDMTVPEIVITGVEDMSANNGEVIPVISFTDDNFDSNGVHIELSGANRGATEVTGAYAAQARGQIYTFEDFPMEQTYDDIYTLHATLTDMAGNETEGSIMFSVNRFGSVYVLDNSVKQIEGTYIQNEIDIKLSEINVDSLEHDKIRVVVDANGTPKDLVEGSDYTVTQTGGNGSWYQYDYTINKALFAGDGRYIVTLYSEDVAGNINENIDESKEAEISFGIDKTAPVVIPIDIESETQYPVDQKSATVTVNDNLVLENVEVYVGKEKCDYTAEGENYTFTVPSASERQDVTVTAIDAAGNRTNYIISNVLVTTNMLIRWYNNKPLFIASIIGVAVFSGAGVGAGIMYRRRRFKVGK